MRRTLVKWVHWLSFFALLYFFFVEPAENAIDRGAALYTHTGVGVVLAVVMLVWLIDHLRGGFVGRPGPKLSDAGKRFHRINHVAMLWGLVLSVVSGAAAGLVAPFDIQAFGHVPLNTGTGSKSLHDTIGEWHGLIFNILTALTLAHIAFHLWRHLRLRDNALKIMAPRALH